MGTPNDTSLALAITFPMLAILAVLARFWARRRKKMKLWWDDWLILPGLVFVIASAVCTILASALANVGKHQPLDAKGLPTFNPGLLFYFARIRYADTILLAPALCFPKLSIIMLYQRIFAVGWFKRITWLMLFINAGWGVSFVLGYMFQCQPISAGWTTSFGINTQHCINLIAFNYAFAASTIVLDVLIIILPWPMIWKLHMPLRQKAAVTGIFLLAGVVTGVSIGKLYVFITVGQVIQQNHDITYDEGPLFYWTIPESSLAVVSACLPTLRPLFHGWSPDSIIGSIRSHFSLPSLQGSNRSVNAPTLEKTKAFKRRSSNESSVGIARLSDDCDPQEGEDNEAGASYIPMNDLDPARRPPYKSNTVQSDI